jgi:hypothetical protein
MSAGDWLRPVLGIALIVAEANQERRVNFRALADRHLELTTNARFSHQAQRRRPEAKAACCG